MNTIDSEGFKGGTRGAPIMPRDAVSRTGNFERTGRHKWVKVQKEVPTKTFIDHVPRCQFLYLIVLLLPIC